MFSPRAEDVLNITVFFEHSSKVFSPRAGLFFAVMYGIIIDCCLCGGIGIRIRLKI